MIVVGGAWRNLAKGHQRVRKLEADLRWQWAAPVEQARRREHEEREARWLSHREAHRREFEQKLRAWRVRRETRQQEFGQRLEEWRRGLDVARQRLKLGVYLSLWLVPLVLGLAVGLVASVVAPGRVPEGTTEMVVILAGAGLLALPVAASPAVLALRAMRRARGREPRLAAEEPEPEFSDLPGRPQFRDGDPVGLDLVRRWWDEISGDYYLPVEKSGDEGENDFVEYLVPWLPDAYLAVRERLVARHLDADLIVVGPTGVWVFEVKHWSGEIYCHEGRWSRGKSYFAPGGYKQYEEEDRRPPDKQWCREFDSVQQTLRRSTPHLGSRLDRLVSGGVVFTHPEAELYIDDSCEAEYGRPLYWANAILDEPELPWFTVELKLQVLDALLKRSDRLEDEEVVPLYATHLAADLYEDAAARARSYLDGR